MIQLLLIQPVAAEPADVLEAMRSAYAQGAVADHLTLDISRSDGTFDALTASIAIDNGAETGIDARTIHYQISGFRFHATFGELRGLRSPPPDPRRALVITAAGRSAGDLLTSVVPAGPLPQLWVPVDSEITDPALGVVRFTAAFTDASITTIIGASALGEVTLAVDSDTGRLISLNAPLRDGSIEFCASPAEPGEPTDWSVDTTGLRVVTRLDQLAPGLPELALAATLPDLTLLTPSGEGVELGAWQEAAPEVGQRSAWSVVLFADATSAAPDEMLRAAASTLASIRAEALDRRADAPPAERFWLRYRPLIVIVLAEEAALADLPALEPPGDADLLLATRPDLTTDRLPAAPIVAVAFDRERVIGAIQPMSEAGAPEAFVDQMVSPAANRGE